MATRIIKTLEERSGGRYVPSPGTVYPTSNMEDQGFVRATEEADRRTYQLTEAGQVELNARPPDSRFLETIQRLGDRPATQQEVDFLQEELEHLERIVWNGLRLPITQGRQETIRRVRSAVEECQAQVRVIVSGRRGRGNGMSTPQPTFENYDAYIGDLFALEDNVLQDTRAAMQAAALRPINVSPTGGQTAPTAGAHDRGTAHPGDRTLGGYSAIWLARPAPRRQADLA